MARFVAFGWKIGLGGSKVEGVNKHSIYQISRHAVVILFVIAWSNLAFCGEIHEAAKVGDLEKVKALLKDNPELVSNRNTIYLNYTPLHYATHWGHKDVAELLLANKADVNATNSDGQTPLHLAAILGYKDLANLLLANKADINANGYHGRTPLLCAAIGGHKDVVELLLVNKSNVNTKDDDGQTPLHAAAYKGQKDLVELLLANNADVNARGKGGETPLHRVAGSNGKKDVVELLLTKGADVNAKRNGGRTPLHEAAFSGYKDVVELLLANKADVNAKLNTTEHLCTVQRFGATRMWRNCCWPIKPMSMPRDNIGQNAIARGN